MRAASTVALVLLFAFAAAVTAQQGVGPLDAAGKDGAEALAAAGERARRGEYAAALEIVGPLAERSDADPETLALAGSLYLELGRPGEALAALERLAAAGSADAVVLFNAGRAALALGERAMGMGYLERSAQRAPLSLAAIALARLRAEDGDHAGAVELLGLLAEGDGAAALAARDASLAAEVSFSQATSLLALGDKESAVASLRRTTELAPANEAAWRQLGETLIELDRVEEAYRAMAEAQTLAEARRGRERETLADEVPPGATVEDLIRQAGEHQAAGRGEEALATLRRAMALAPNDPRPRVMEIRLLISLHREAEALPRADMMVRIAPESPEGYYLRGMARLASQDLGAAEEDLRRVLELDPNHLAGLNGLAILLMARDESTEAEQVLLRALERWPGDELTTRNLAKARRQLGGAG